MTDNGSRASSKGDFDVATPIPVRTATASMQAAGLPPEVVEPLAAAIKEGMSGGGGASWDPKAAKKHAWIIGLVVALFGSGGIVTSYYLTEARSVDNAKAINEHSAEPMHKHAAKRVETIERDIKETKRDVSQIKTQQTAIATGIEQLKEEAQTEKQKRLERELEEARRELRRERRRR